MRSGLYVIGTQRTVGKTTLVRALARLLSQRGLRAGVVKPVETGCELRQDVAELKLDGLPDPVDADAVEALARLSGLAGPPPAAHLGSVPSEALISRHAALLSQAAGGAPPHDLICPVRFAADLDPAVAARLRGDPDELELSQLSSSVDAAGQGGDLLLVEGGWGLFSPLSSTHLELDLVQRLGFPVVLMVPSSLGVISPCLMALDALRARKISVAGVVFNRLNERVLYEEGSNPFQVEQHHGPLVRGVLPHFEADQLEDLDFLAQRLEVHVDLDAMLDLAES